MYHFLSGYTAKVAGTEKGVTEPKATFSTCFRRAVHGVAPQRLRQAARREDRAAHARVWLVNTGLDRRAVRRGTRG
jgi:phosphoenolpyruvate carboxykinase (ATP)